MYINAYTCGRVPSRALSHKSTYTLNLFSVFLQHILGAYLCFINSALFCRQVRTHLNVVQYYISIFANIWYLIKLIHSIIIILRVSNVLYNSASWQTFVPVASAAVHEAATLYRSGPDLYINAYTCGAYLHGKLLRSFKRRIRSICASRMRSGHYFPIWHLCTIRTHLNVAIISLFLANIWYLIKLIHSIIIILRVFMFYKQRVLANVWGRKDSTICASRKRSGACFCAVHMKWAIHSLFMPTTLSFRPQKSAKTRYI